VRVVNDEQDSKQQSPIEITESGIVRVANDEQDSKQ
jgi:hypothetical protein